MKIERLFILLGSLSGFIAVAAGAFGAHALRQRLPSEMLSIFETGARYQMYHALALLAVGIAASIRQAPSIQLAGWCFVAGTVLFSGSLDLLAFTENRVIGALTPLGGMAFLLGWLSLAWGVWRQG